MKFLARTILVLLVLLTPVISAIEVGAQDVVTIEWWSVAGNELPAEAQEAVAAAFNAQQDNIQVNLTILPGDGYDTRMTTAIGAGSGAPDVALFWDNNWWPQTLDLTPYLEADPDLGPEDYFENFFLNWAIWQENGAIVGLPFGVGANFVMYNKDIFDEAGVAYPTADWTPDDYIEIATQVTDRDSRQWGGDRPRGVIYRAIGMGYNAFPYSDDSTMVDGYLNSEESLAAFTWLWDLVDSGVTLTPSDVELLGTEGTGPVDLFLAGRLAMATMNEGHMQTAVAEGFNFGVVPEPHASPDNERYVNAWSLTASVWAGSEHPDEAYEFLSFFAGPEGQRIMMEQGNTIPSIPAVLADFEHADEDWAQAFFAVLEYKQVAEWTGAHPCYRSAVRQVIQDVRDLIDLGEVERDGIKDLLDEYVGPAQDALDECVPRLGG